MMETVIFFSLFYLKIILFYFTLFFSLERRRACVQAGVGGGKEKILSAFHAPLQARHGTPSQDRKTMT